MEERRIYTYDKIFKYIMFINLDILAYIRNILRVYRTDDKTVSFYMFNIN